MKTHVDGLPYEQYEGSVAYRAPLLALMALGLTPSARAIAAGGVSLTPHYAPPDGDPMGDKIDQLTQAIRELGAQRAADAAGLADSHPSRDVKAQSDWEARKAWVAPSMARSVASGALSDDSANSQAFGLMHPYLKAGLQETVARNYVPGTFIRGLVDARDNDAEAQARGKANLHALGVRFADTPETSVNKATLASTGATGGYVLPNNLVDTVAKPSTMPPTLADLVTVRTGVNVRGVDIPYRMGAPARMVFQDWGATKENVDETYGSYTASLGTIARIMDISKQYARFSSGSAEADVLDELEKARVLGESYYLLAGAGTGTGPVGDPTTGIFTALNATPAFLGYKTAKTGAASNSTVVGAFASACAEAMGLLAARSRFADAIYVDAVTYFTCLQQGSDTAGYWLSPGTAAGGLNIDPATGRLRYWNVPIVWDSNATANGMTAKALIAGEFKAAKLYRGSEFRIDSSDVAGTRWDKNLIGFRGEEEIGFNADPPVHVGAFQLLTAVIP